MIIARSDFRRVRRVRLMTLAATLTLASALTYPTDAAAGGRSQPSRSDSGERVADVDYPAVNDRTRPRSTNGLLDMDTLESPGMHIANTFYDLWHYHSQGRQIARNPGEDFVHMTWTHYDRYAQFGIDRFVNYAAWDVAAGDLVPGFDGASIGLGDFAQAGFPRLDVDSDNKCHVVLHQRSDPGIQNYSAWHLYQTVEGSGSFTPEQLPDYLHWPTDDFGVDVAITQNQGQTKYNSTDIYHIIAMPVAEYGTVPVSSGDIEYWRWDQAVGGNWNLPVVLDSFTSALSYVIDAADGTGKVAVAFTQNYEAQWNGLANIVYRESQTGGMGWVNGTELGNANRHYVTNYTDNTTPGPQAWAHISIAYDHDAVLHLVWDEQRYADGIAHDVAIRHWDDSRQTMDRVARGYYQNGHNPPGDLNLTKITLGIGDGSAFCTEFGSSNENFLYVLFTKNCGESPAERADYSRYGYCNSELYINGSHDGGATWSKPVNLSNTKTPDCHTSDPGSVCASEVMASIARDISGQEGIDILYLFDLEAGPSIPGEWATTINPVKYLNLPGGNDAPFVCPLLAPSLDVLLEQTAECEYHAPSGGGLTIALEIDNGGNAPLNGSVMVMQGGSWLSVAPGGPFALQPADPPLLIEVTMDASSLPNGYYAGEIQITHDDTLIADPQVYPIEFFVTEDYSCPEAKILKTASSSPWVLGLQVGNNGRFGVPDLQGRLLRMPDSSYGIGDASLVIAHGEQSPDTVVFHQFGNNEDDPGQYGFLPVAPLSMDTSAYGTGMGYASATAIFNTRDSLLEVTATWYAPQHADSADFVVAKYVLRNRTNEAGMLPQTLENIVAGLWIDFNVIPAKHVHSQWGNDNGSGFWPDSNLVYQRGLDSIGYSPPDYFTSAGRFSAGVTYMSGRDALGQFFHFQDPVPIRVGVRSNSENLPGPSNGYTGTNSGLIYRRMAGIPGLFYDPAGCDADRYTHYTLDQGLTLAPGETQHYIVAYVSDTLQNFSYGPAPGQTEDAGLHRVVQKAWKWAHSNLGCVCPNVGDPAPDGVVNVFDVIEAIDVAFRNGSPSQSIYCPFADTDVNCDATTNVFDVVAIVDVAFRSADPATAFCQPCA
ncbi:MAG TPA: hypothetical protein VGB22_08735 [candidate division Zixibacteria bacterium]